MYTTFVTPGKIPIEAFTHFGVNSKPNSANPIGYFGTGLKYAIAVLVREQIPVTLWIGRTKYQFVASEEDFRGKEFTFITLKRSKGTFWTKTPLPFTTELGKNWELWQAFRELYANTLDEGGTCWTSDDDYDRVANLESDQTVFVVGGAAMAEIATDRAKYFLPGGSQKYKGQHVEVLPQESESIYYRSMRVMGLPHKAKKSLYTYNLLAGMQLTEDRTLAYPFMVDEYVKDCIVKSDDPEFIDNVLRASESVYEGKLDFSNHSTIPSETFRKVYYQNRGSSARYSYMSGRLGGYMSREAPPNGHVYLKDASTFLEHLRTLGVRQDWHELDRIVRLNGPFYVDALGQAVKALGGATSEDKAIPEQPELELEPTTTADEEIPF